MCIGSLETGFDLENAERLLNFANITSERCKRCWCFRHCTLCAKKADTGEAQLSPTATAQPTAAAAADDAPNVFQRAWRWVLGLFN